MSAPTGPFYTEAMRRWLHGYEPVAAAEMCLPRAGKTSDPVRREQIKRAAGQRKPGILKGSRR